MDSHIKPSMQGTASSAGAACPGSLQEALQLGQASVYAGQVHILLALLFGGWLWRLTQVPQWPLQVSCFSSLKLWGLCKGHMQL